MSKTIKKPFKSLVIEDDYPDFHVFFSENKIHVYRAIIDLFKSFLGTKKKNLSLRIDAKINGVDWNSDFNFNVQYDVVVLMRDLMPFFIENEMYEVCAEIRDIHDRLISDHSSKGILSKA